MRIVRLMHCEARSCEVEMRRFCMIAAMTGIAVALVWLASLPGAAEAAVSCRKPAIEEHKAVLDTLRAPVAIGLKSPVEFVVRKIRICGADPSEWAFIDAKPQRPGGGSLDWTGAGYEDCSRSVFGLLRQSKGSAWSVIEVVICPTDVTWDGWDTQFGAPRELFQGLYE